VITPREVGENIVRSVEQDQPALAKMAAVEEKLAFIQQVGLQLMFGGLLTEEEFMKIAIGHDVADHYLRKAHVALFEGDKKAFEEHLKQANQIAYKAGKLAMEYLDKAKPAAGNPDYRYPDRRQGV
jgi:predicted AAA+ superfamily ATPase